ncbi:hypothetical protein GCM10011588_03010 [Nocardia jinanensis]|uniref:Uncharacterized protein n=1 Tax=Nocardia jinanensis TaxID=382504 RepID=A0A917R6I3_9NOCA|nr:hypothetical protein GCM10011588_03010 [Nocardia jinanensis]
MGGGQHQMIVATGPAQCTQCRDRGEQITETACLKHENYRHPTLLATCCPLRRPLPNRSGEERTTREHFLG